MNLALVCRLLELLCSKKMIDKPEINYHSLSILNSTTILSIFVYLLVQQVSYIYQK